MKFFFFVLLILVSQHIFSQKFDKNYFSPPLKIPLLLTGNFGELRSNHFHSGIDIKTEGKTGLPVHASAEGYVSRINVSPSGFGLAVYVDHPNGTTTVYGHLSKLRDDLQKYVRNIQYQRESFRIDLNVPKNKFQVKKDEIIAYSGNSGSSGGPHLHFEIRETISQHPLNPLTFSFPIKDEMKPKILSLMIYPLSDDSHVGGKQQPQRIETVYYDGAYHLKGNPTYSVFGDIGFGLQALDYLDGSWSKCGIYQIKLFVDGQMIYDFKMDELSFDETRYINSHIDYEHYRTQWRKFHKNWLEPGNKLNNYHQVINSGISNLSDGKLHQVNYEIEDAYGNTSKLSFQIKSKETQLLHAKQNGYRVYFDKKSTISTNDFEADFEAGTFYSDYTLEVNSKPSNNLYYSNIIHLHNPTIPAHQYFNIKINPTTLPDTLQDNALIVNIDDKSGKKYAMGGSFKNGWVNAKIRSLGSFAIDVDTIAPIIKSLSIRANNKLIEQSRIRFKISDDLSGVNTYRGEIDGKWILFEYDAKNNLLEYTFDPTRIQYKQNHNLKLTVSDAKGNETVYKASIYR
ncbi:M23 family metallopeptidase [Sunxiuqinia sp. A32]|uniref:M23 family metallopeptidase n=1 Tax=Sunxiuqinia sp. A32 TaxID=3461496 RepID=UPI004045845D